LRRINALPFISELELRAFGSGEALDVWDRGALEVLFARMTQPGGSPCPERFSLRAVRPASARRPRLSSARGWNVVATMHRPEAGAELAGFDNVLVATNVTLPRCQCCGAVRRAIAREVLRRKQGVNSVLTLPRGLAGAVTVCRLARR